jgi:cysteine desulfuration protein SufE
MDAVPECMTPVSVFAEEQSGRLQFYFDVPPESPTVRGYAAILAEGLESATPEEVLALPNDFYQQMGLHQVLSYQRLHGMAAILAHIKKQAAKALQSHTLAQPLDEA